MKRRNKDLIADIADLDNLYLAFWKAQKGKTYKAEVAVCQLDVAEPFGCRRIVPSFWERFFVFG